MPRARPPQLDPDDLGLWHEVTKTVAPIKSRKKPSPRKGPPAETMSDLLRVPVAQPHPWSQPAVPPALPLAAAPKASGVAPGLDRGLSQRLKDGKMPIDARLDLHGRTEADAHASLESFLRREARAGSRLLLVITGKGRDGKGVLRTNLRRWLEVPALARLVLAVQQAPLKHGGEGAFYVLLRKNGGKAGLS